MKDDGKTHFCAEPCPAVSARKLPAAHWAPRGGPPAQKSAAACQHKGAACEFHTSGRRRGRDSLEPDAPSERCWHRDRVAGHRWRTGLFTFTKTSITPCMARRSASHEQVRGCIA